MSPPMAAAIKSLATNKNFPRLLYAFKSVVWDAGWTIEARLLRALRIVRFML
jgi:hypothetical protein